MEDTMQLNSPETTPTKRPRQLSAGNAASPTSSPAKAKNGGKGQRKSTSLPSETVEYLKAWMMSPEHIAHPYPTEQEKAQIMADTGIELKQLTNWFVNNRKRYWKPRVEARLQQQAHAAAAVAQAQAAAAAVAAVTAASRQASPVTPESGLRPTLTVQPSNSFVSFDLCAPQTSTPRKTTRTISMVSPDFSKFLPSAQSSIHAVSEASSASSVATAESTDSMDSSSADDMGNVSSGEDSTMSGVVSRTEMVDVHILRPISGRKPTIEDVTVLSHVPSERILKTFKNCSMDYHFPSTDNKKMQSRRDAEIVRIKKHYLKVYAEETRLSLTSKKRKQQDGIVCVSPRKQFRRVSVELWRDACHSADHTHDASLPTMEEATQLFGYAN